MKHLAIAATTVGLLMSGCSSGNDEPAENAATQTAATLQPGEYEVVAKVDDLRSTDNTTPATELKVGGPPVTSKSCFGADGAIPPAAFAEGSESCDAGEVYARNGRLSLQLRCNRTGKGSITHTVDGTFKADSFEARVTSGTYFSGTGDYALTRTVTGRRVGQCSAGV